MTECTARTDPDRRQSREVGPSPVPEPERGPWLPNMFAPSQTLGPELRVLPARVQGGLALNVQGEVDLANHEDFYRAISQALAAQLVRGCVVLDFSVLCFIDSSGVHALIRAHHEVAANQVRLRIVGPAPWVARLLRLTGLDTRIPVFDTFDRALSVAHRAR